MLIYLDLFLLLRKTKNNFSSIYPRSSWQRSAEIFIFCNASLFFVVFNDLLHISFMVMFIAYFEFTFFLRRTFYHIDTESDDNIPPSAIFLSAECHIVCRRRVVSNIESNFTLHLNTKFSHSLSELLRASTSPHSLSSVGWVGGGGCWSKRSSCWNWMRMTTKVASVVNIYTHKREKRVYQGIANSNHNRQRLTVNSSWEFMLK